MYNIKEIKNYLKQHLSEYRYEHCVLVAEEAQKLATHYGINAEKAYVAGLTHDIAKEFSDEENKKWIEDYNIQVDLNNTRTKPIIHGDIGAVVVKELYNLDEDICNSIKYHSTGNYPMTLFEKIIFVSDKVARKDADEDLLRLKKLAYEDIDSVIVECLNYTKKVLEKSNLSLEPISETLLEHLNKGIK